MRASAEEGKGLGAAAGGNPLRDLVARVEALETRSLALEEALGAARARADLLERDLAAEREARMAADRHPILTVRAPAPRSTGFRARMSSFRG